MSYPRMDVRPDETKRRFTMRCSLCGKAAHAGRLPFLFQKRGPDSAGYARAYMRSYQQLVKQFNYCQSCGRWVCDDCFNIEGDRDACEECAAKSM